MQKGDNGDASSISDFAEELALSGDDGIHKTNDEEQIISRPNHFRSLGGPNIDLVLSIPMTVKVILGSTAISVSALANLEHGKVVPLDRRVGDKVDIVVNGRVIAFGAIVLLDEQPPRFAVSVTDVQTRTKRSLEV